MCRSWLPAPQWGRSSCRGLTPESMPPFDYAGPLELSYPLPAWEGADRPMLELGGLHGTRAELWLDGEPFQRIPAGMGWAYVTLPGDCARVTLRLDKRAEDAMPFLLTDSATVLEQARRTPVCSPFPPPPSLWPFCWPWACSSTAGSRGPRPGRRCCPAPPPRSGVRSRWCGRGRCHPPWKCFSRTRCSAETACCWRCAFWRA